MKRRPVETFGEVVARLTRTPARGPRVPQGRHGDYWGDPEQHRYELVEAHLSPEDAVTLAQSGARVVYDACGCGGDCGPDWLSAQEVQRVAAAGPPSLRPGKHGRADLQHWRSTDGLDLIVTAVDVSWGDRIHG